MQFANPSTPPALPLVDKSQLPVVLFFELPVIDDEEVLYFGKKKCCGKFRKKGKKMCKKCPGRN